MSNSNAPLNTTPAATLAVSAAAVLASAPPASAALTPQRFISDLQNEDADVRFAAWDQADQMDPEVIYPLGKLLAADSPKSRRSADEALKKIVHSVGKQPGGEKRNAVVAKLLELLADDLDDWVRTNALRHLSLIGESGAVGRIAKLVQNPPLREEAVFCLERIPGEASLEALRKALPDAAADFQPRILAALGHRRDRQAVDLCVDALQSEDADIALAAMKAIARIGEKIDVALDVPDPAALSDWQRIEHSDSALRYADAQAARGNHHDAWSIYTAMLGREEAHLQCAAIIGMSKMGTSGAAAAIFSKLTSTSNEVRLTAAKAWTKMKTTALGQADS